MNLLYRPINYRPNKNDQLKLKYECINACAIQYFQLYFFNNEEHEVDKLLCPLLCRLPATDCIRCIRAVAEFPPYCIQLYSDNIICN